MSWEDRLSDPIELPGETGKWKVLYTLRDAAEFLVERYSSRKGGLIDATVQDLMEAAERPTPSRIDIATDAVEAFLAFEMKIPDTPRRVNPKDDVTRRIVSMLALKRRSPADPKPPRPKKG